MKFSLWTGDTYIQSSDDSSNLQCNTSQLRAWCESMGVTHIAEQLVIRDNQHIASCSVFHAQYKLGAPITWRTSPQPVKLESNATQLSDRYGSRQMRRAPPPKTAKIYNL